MRFLLVLVWLALGTEAWSLTANDCFPIGAGACTTGTFVGEVLDTGAGSSAYNVQAYGAIGDGLTPDDAAINSALLAARNAGGGRVYLPPGVYLLNAALVVGDNTELAGAGPASILKRSAVWPGCWRAADARKKRGR